ncbi:unnamed protein product [Chrysodeixis includens]|uniref:Uncharacterized protein n=1 Tax=Chrysodeixis includens TaxID=689277 RepID=A0A9P0C1J6_CHRIL|nr:unnamed protein product [Chrysodeixis includens]
MDDCCESSRTSPKNTFQEKLKTWLKCNTPSQTEVKIISCIPIDVTDLQQKILHLERQLDDSGKCSPSIQLPDQNPITNKVTRLPKPTLSQRRTVNAVLCETNFPHVSTTAVTCNSLDCDRSTSPACTQAKKKSSVSFTFPKTNEADNISHIRLNLNAYTAEERTTEAKELVPTYDYVSKMTERNEQRKNFFSNKKRLLKKSKKAKSPYVYYAQTNSSPFKKTDMMADVPKNDNDLSRSYLCKMINKQYKPKLLGGYMSQASEFSTPICRDTLPHTETPDRFESDLCSCCHGAFHNIDNNVTVKYPQTYMVNEMNTGNVYYDTKDYDLVPVRETPLKIKNDYDFPRRKEVKPQIDIRCWPENIRSKYKGHLYYGPPGDYPFKLNYNYVLKNRPDYCSRHVRKLSKLNRIEPLRKKVALKRRRMNRDRHIRVETSKSCYIDIGSNYPKKTFKKPKVQKSLQPIPVLHKNAECLTTVINNSECQTVTSNIEANLTEAKTEATLNQIKSILQSVLAEVKVSSQTRSQMSEEKAKKDAVVQKGPSQSNMQGSSLMNSITYSPYAMNPNPYMASCSRQLNSGPLCYPPAPLKCFQNFPLFIQTQGRHICATCYRNSSHIKSGPSKQATTIATNTDEMKEEAKNKETEKLIKEIYKSMALTMDIGNRDTSQSDYQDVDTSTHVFGSPIIIRSEPKKQSKNMKNVVQAMSEIFAKKEVAESSESPNTIVESKLPSHNTSVRSQLVTTDTEVKLRRDRLEKFMRARYPPPIMEADRRVLRKGFVHNVTTITESESSSTESDSDVTLVLPKEPHEPKQKKEKQGLFSKMLKSVKLFKTKEKVKNKEEKTEKEVDTSSDSADYQTVYSQKIERTLNHKHRAHVAALPKRKTHSKISYKHAYQRDRSPEKRKPPYMEQEYRRHWNERLMFQDNRARHSSEQAYSTSTTQKTPYYQVVEARNASLEPKKTFIPKANFRKGRGNREESAVTAESKFPGKGLAWLKKQKMGIHCGDQWKKLILES